MMNEEMIAKAKEAKSVGELIALAKENGIELTEEDAKMYFEQLNAKKGELSDDELDCVAGGGCLGEEERYCPNCQTRLERRGSCHGLYLFYQCNNCGYEEPDE